MSPLSPPSASCVDGHCITCSDEGAPMRVVRVDERRGLALCVDAAGVRHTVETALLEPVAAGEWVLVHAGVAIALVPGQQEGPRGTPCRQPAAQVAG